MRDYPSDRIRIEQLERRVNALTESLQAFREALSDGPENLTYLRYEELDEQAKKALEV